MVNWLLGDTALGTRSRKRSRKRSGTSSRTSSKARSGGEKVRVKGPGTSSCRDSTSGTVPYDLGIQLRVAYYYVRIYGWRLASTTVKSLTVCFVGDLQGTARDCMDTHAHAIFLSSPGI